MRSVYLGSTAGIFHPPEGSPSGLGVVFVPPFGWDDQSTYRPRRAWAAALAADGHAVLRIDLPGTGDSGGGPHDAGLVDTWRQAIADAVAWLGTERTALVGLGLGGLLGLDSGVDELVLWGAPARGSSALRELRAFGRLEAARTGEPAGDGPGIRAGGHVLTAETVAAVEALGAEGMTTPPRRALVLGRDGTPPDKRLVAALEAAGTVVVTGDGEGWGAAVAGPQEAEVPAAVIATTSAWLAEGDPVAAPERAGAASSLEVDGVRETPSTIAGCFAVTAEPLGGDAGALTAVLLNAGAIRHIGPNRMWVEAARRWAARGVPTLRVDLQAIGESGGDDAPFGDDANFYVPALTAQVKPVLDAAVARGLPDRFLICGLCSGGYWALHTAVEDPRVVSTVLLNPRLLFWDAQAGSRREVRRALSVFTPTGFRRLVRADRPFARLLTILRYLLVRPFRRSAPAVAVSAVRELAAALLERGQRLELAFSGEEPLHDELVRSGDAEWLESAGVPIHALPLHSHTLKPLDAQRATHAVLDAAVERALRA